MTFCSVMVKARAIMHITQYSLILCSLFWFSDGLDCRSEGGPKENEIKKIYNVCMKQQNKNNSNHDEDFWDQDWWETRNHDLWSRDNVARNRGNDNFGYGTEEGDHDNVHKMDGDRTQNQHKVSPQDGRSRNRDNRMQHRERDEDDKMNSRDEDERINSRDGRGERQNRNGDNRTQRNNNVNGRNDFYQNENFGEHNSNQYSTQPTRRHKRERRVEVNSGKRSQYNPNPQRYSFDADKYKNDEISSSENTTADNNNTACALHCLLGKLKMTDESGMPDRYLVTHTFTKDVKDDDLKDFLQEAIEECFQILNNENTDDKCEFSKNLLTCLSEKGRANCDDWKDDIDL